MSANLKRIQALLAAILLLFPLLAGCTDPGTSQDSSLPSTEPTQETIPLPTAPPDGNPNDVTCQGSYSVTDEELSAGADRVIATLGQAELTNRQLQIYYWLEVAGYLRENTNAEFAYSLDTLFCETETAVITWQQYFLQRALNTWASHQALIAMAAEQGLPTDESYQPNAKQHQLHISSELPALKYFYGYVHKNYTPNERHQQYLDSLPALLEELAQKNGYTDAQSMAQDLALGGAEELNAYAQTMNRAYSYFTDRVYYMEPTDEEVDAYFTAHEAEYAKNGITRDSGYYVDLRHILLIPQDAILSADGTVTCGEEAWEDCRISAQSLLNTIRGYSDAKFAEVAFEKSQDPGSSLNGGLYSGLSQGQLTAVLDQWIFDPAREPGDTDILRSGSGYHVVRFKGSQPIWYVQARADLIRRQSLDLVIQALEANPLTVSYADICLGTAPQSGTLITADDLLYPDVAHERFPTAPVYLQQDYPNTMYGAYPISTHGCGITTMAMLATYMTDEEWTPPEMCALYGRFCTNEGTNYMLFEIAPAEMGFFMEQKISFDWPAVWEQLESGRVVANLQYKGYWTRAGHFLMLQRFNEDGNVVTRDSNILNYDRIPAHMQDAHATDSFLAAGFHCWVYQPKVTRIPTCVRCGEDAQGVPFAMFTQDYLCTKCTAATARREGFVLACGDGV